MANGDEDEAGENGAVSWSLWKIHSEYLLQSVLVHFEIEYYVKVWETLFSTSKLYPQLAKLICSLKQRQ
jgi:hypothetical protein